MITHPDTVRAVEADVIDYFVHVAGSLKLPRSLGELYGALFISADPLCMEDLIDRLQLSKGATSQGLKILRSYGAVRTVYQPGSRKIHYEAERELKALIAGFIRERIEPSLDESRARLNSLRNRVKTVDGPDRKRIEGRVAKIAQWNQRAKRVLPVMASIMKRMA